MLSTARVALKRITPADSGWLHALDNDPAVMRYINGGLPVSEATFRSELLSVLMETEDHVGFFSIWMDSAPQGWCSLRRSGTAEEITLGYRLMRDAWGKGIATEACTALLAHGFRDLAVESVTATTYEENTRSIKVLEKLGFSLKRRFRWDSDQASDTAIASLDEPWPGWDLEFVLARQHWEERSRA